MVVRFLLQPEERGYTLAGTEWVLPAPIWGRLLGVGARQSAFSEDGVYYAAVLDLFNEGFPVVLNMGAVVANRFYQSLVASAGMGLVKPDIDTPKYVIMDAVESVSVRNRQVYVPRFRFMSEEPQHDEKVYPAIPQIQQAKIAATLPGLEGVELPEFAPLPTTEHLETERITEGEVEVVDTDLESAE